MSLNEQMKLMLPIVENELHRQIDRIDKPQFRAFHDMLTYHMGWTNDNQERGTSGKRIRPLLLLLVTFSCDQNWLQAVPAAAAVELVHNFSLVHDDIEDNSKIRHGRATVWDKYGIPMAINVGDAIFSIANQAILDLSDENSAEIVLKSGKILHDTCLQLTCGQFLDMSYEKRNDMPLDDYWPMIEGKTAALLTACTQIGAILGSADEAAIEQYRLFGRYLGLAFQVQDDLIGIWGEETRTGKSSASDLVEGKNSLPILYGINQRGKFSQWWSKSRFTSEDIVEASQLLKEEGAYDYSRRETSRLTEQALAALEKANPHGEAGAALVELVNKLLVRDS